MSTLAPGRAESFPSALLLQVFGLLDHVDQASSRAVCRRWTTLYDPRELGWPLFQEVCGTYGRRYRLSVAPTLFVRHANNCWRDLHKAHTTSGAFGLIRLCDRLPGPPARLATTDRHFTVIGCTGTEDRGASAPGATAPEAGAPGTSAAGAGAAGASAAGASASSGTGAPGARAGVTVLHVIDAANRLLCATASSRGDATCMVGGGGQLLLGHADGGAVVLATASLEEVRRLAGAASPVSSVGMNGQFYVRGLSDGRVELVDRQGQGRDRWLAIPNNPTTRAPVGAALSIHLDGTVLEVGHADGTVATWSTSDKATAPVLFDASQEYGPVSCMATNGQSVVRVYNMTRPNPQGYRVAMVFENCDRGDVETCWIKDVHRVHQIRLCGKVAWATCESFHRSSVQVWDVTNPSALMSDVLTTHEVGRGPCMGAIDTGGTRLLLGMAELFEVRHCIAPGDDWRSLVDELVEDPFSASVPVSTELMRRMRNMADYKRVEAWLVANTPQMAAALDKAPACFWSVAIACHLISYETALHRSCFFEALAILTGESKPEVERQFLAVKPGLPVMGALLALQIRRLAGLAGAFSRAEPGTHRFNCLIRELSLTERRAVTESLRLILPPGADPNQAFLGTIQIDAKLRGQAIENLIESYALARLAL